MKLAEWARGFVEKYRTYVDDLADVGVKTAQEAFDNVNPEYGNGGVHVYAAVSIEDETSMEIIASGEDAAFIEFGTGVGVTYNPTFAIQSEFPIEDGSWSRATGGMYAQKGYWFYKTPDGEKLMLRGTPAMGGMQEACIHMQQQAPDIARRVFG